MGRKRSFVSDESYASSSVSHTSATSFVHNSSSPFVTSNALTALSVVPGQLDYEAYKQLLVQLGHVKTSSGSNVTRDPAKAPILQRILTDDRNDDRTDWRADQAGWSEENMPDILYVFTKPPGWLAKRQLQEPPLKDYLIHGKLLRDIPILPDHISKDLEGWRLQAWYRMDPRIHRQDIIDRILGQADRFSTIQMRNNRFCHECPALGWVHKGGKFEQDRQDIMDKLVRQGIDLTRNTTRGVSWGLINPAAGEIGGRIAIPESLRWCSSVENVPELLSIRMATARSSPRSTASATGKWSGHDAFTRPNRPIKRRKTRQSCSDEEEEPSEISRRTRQRLEKTRSMRENEESSGNEENTKKRCRRGRSSFQDRSAEISARQRNETSGRMPGGTTSSNIQPQIDDESVQTQNKYAGDLQERFDRYNSYTGEKRWISEGGFYDNSGYASYHMVGDSGVGQTPAAEELHFAAEGVLNPSGQTFLSATRYRSGIFSGWRSLF